MACVRQAIGGKPGSWNLTVAYTALVSFCPAIMAVSPSPSSTSLTCCFATAVLSLLEGAM